MISIKNLRYFPFFLCLFFIKIDLSAQVQRFKAGFNFGLTAAQIDGDDANKFNKLGLTAGLSAYTVLTPKADLIIEMLYSQRGSRTALNTTTSNLPVQIINLHYLEIPIIYSFKDWYQEDADYFKMNFQVGLSYGRLFKSRFKESPFVAVAPFFRENDFSWLVSVTYHTNENMGFYARYTRSINLLFKNDGTNPNANSLLSFFLSFGGRYVF